VPAELRLWKNFCLSSPSGLLAALEGKCAPAKNIQPRPGVADRVPILSMGLRSAKQATEHKFVAVRALVGWIFSSNAVLS